ncbi:MAG: hypothetical protein ABFC67_03115 [Mizugakiibacter sp.]|uniref:hypothetical protein n=1 Tax=Mizugakiibacter sp. TaxID=1972610 RepID=UPI0031C6DA89|nr:DUF2845 domain-containing protein [Xanthomonadaceae bacterium]
MRRIIPLALCLLCGIAAAADTVRIGTHLIEVGDSAALLRDVAGEPDARASARAAPAARGSRRRGARRDAGSGERWTYRDRGRTLGFVIRDGVIVAIEQGRR